METKVKVSREQAAENRATLVRVAGRLFRAKGIDGVGIAEICKEAGLTHGALYGQFKSKDALAAEALTHGLKRSHRAMLAASNKLNPALEDYVDFFVSTEQRDNLSGGCPMAASSSEIARKDRTISARFSEGFQETAEAIEATLDPGFSALGRRQRGLAIAAAMIGGIAIARATAKSNPKLSDDIVLAVRQAVKEIGMPHKKAQPKKAPASRSVR
jgi:TetR/AcrR family transcriptional repressor of nem operon